MDVTLQAVIIEIISQSNLMNFKLKLVIPISYIRSL